MTTVEVRSGEGFSREQQLDNSDGASARVEEIRVFQSRTLVCDAIPDVAHLCTCTNAPTLFVSVCAFAVLVHRVQICRSQWDFDGRVSFEVTTLLNAICDLTASLLSVRTGSSRTLDLAQDTERQ